MVIKGLDSIVGLKGQSNSMIMKKSLKLCLLFIFLSGCASLIHTTPTKPNISYIHYIPSLSKQLPVVETETKKGGKQITQFEKEANFLFEDLYKRNPKLALEIGKLPEWQDGISAKEVAALRNIIELYDYDPVAFNLAFDMMYKEGKPDVRRFCSPLQALFWQSGKNKFSRENNPLKDFQIKTWLYPYINDSIKNGESKWTNFDEVTDRLNSPTLVFRYILLNIAYDAEHNMLLTPYQVFKYKIGHCHEQSLLAAYCLEKAGYDAVLVRAWSPTWTSGHTVVAYHDDGKLYKLDTSRGLGIRGPFKSYAEIAESLPVNDGDSGGLHITVLPWKAYTSSPMNR